MAATKPLSTFRSQHLLVLAIEPLKRVDVFHVFWSLPAQHVKRDSHAEILEYRSSRIGEDWERAFSVGLVLWNELGRAAANNDDRGGNGHGEVCLQVDGFGDCFDVRLTSLLWMLAWYRYL